jgi:hypothetical protein
MNLLDILFPKRKQEKEELKNLMTLVQEQKELLYILEVQ